MDICSATRESLRKARTGRFLRRTTAILVELPGEQVTHYVGHAVEDDDVPCAAVNNTVPRYTVSQMTQHLNVCEVCQAERQSLGMTYREKAALTAPSPLRP